MRYERDELKRRGVSSTWCEIPRVPDTRSSSVLSLRLDRIDGVLASGRVPPSSSAAAPPSARGSTPPPPWANGQAPPYLHAARGQRQRRHRFAGDVGSGLERFDAVGFAADDVAPAVAAAFGSNREGVHYGQTVTRGGGGGGGGGGSGGLGLGDIAAEEGRKATPRIVVYAASTSKGINLGVGGAGGGGGGNGGES